MDTIYISFIISGIVLLAFMVGRLGREKKIVEAYCSGYNDALRDLQAMGEIDKNVQIIVKK